MSRSLYLFFRYGSAIRHWLRRHISRSGFLLFITLLFSSSLGAHMGQNTVFHFFTLLLVLGFVSICFCLYFKAHIRVVRHLPDFVTEGESFRYRAVIENQGSRVLRNIEFYDELDWHYPTYSEFCNFNKTYTTKSRYFLLVPRWNDLLQKGIAIERERQNLVIMRPETPVEMWQKGTPLRRGIVRYKSVTFFRSDPFGLFWSLSSVSCVNSLLVLPRRYLLPPIQLGGSRKYQPSGVTLASVIGDSQEFLSMRDYRPGDPPRTIHWRSWAKTGKPMVKEFQDEYFNRHGLILDTFATDCSDQCFEKAISVAASFACTVADRDSLLDLLFVGTKAYCFTTGRSVGHSQQLLEILATVQPSPSDSFDELQQLIQQRSNLLSSCICVLLAWDKPRQKMISDILASGIPVLPLVISENEDEVRAQMEGMDSPMPVKYLHPDRIEEGLAKI